ncbi:hypothetical protein [Mesorhizobium sp. M8A.F.Ca.ET.182.01.1.1]|uniref:hypothetical protein n=1 Tax=unclassified Mesorhizobium TaxID=325217 RepID=UPI0016727A20
MRLRFVAPLMPTHIAQPSEGENWLHEVKFDGFRWQLIIDENGTRIYTQRSRLERPSSRARGLSRIPWAESAIVNGEIIVLNNAGLSDFAGCARPPPPGSTTSISWPSICCISICMIARHGAGRPSRDPGQHDRDGGRIQFTEPLPGEAKAACFFPRLSGGRSLTSVFGEERCSNQVVASNLTVTDIHDGHDLVKDFEFGLSYTRCPHSRLQICQARH